MNSNLPKLLGGLYIFQYKWWVRNIRWDVQYGYTDAVKISAWLIELHCFSACGCRVCGAQYCTSRRDGLVMKLKLKRTMLFIHSVINNTTVLLILFLLWPTLPYSVPPYHTLIYRTFNQSIVVALLCFHYPPLFSPSFPTLTSFLLLTPEMKTESTIQYTPIHSPRRTNSLKKPNPHRPCIRAENQENADANMQMQHRKVT